MTVVRGPCSRGGPIGQVQGHRILPVVVLPAGGGHGVRTGHEHVCESLAECKATTGNPMCPPAGVQGRALTPCVPVTSVCRACPLGSTPPLRWAHGVVVRPRPPLRAQGSLLRLWGPWAALSAGTGLSGAGGGGARARPEEEWNQGGQQRSCDERALTARMPSSTTRCPDPVPGSPLHPAARPWVLCSPLGACQSCGHTRTTRSS